MDYTKLSKEISYALRHAPWEYELELDEEGFVPVVQLIHALNESGEYKETITKDDILHGNYDTQAADIHAESSGGLIFQ